MWCVSLTPPKTAPHAVYTVNAPLELLASRGSIVSEEIGTSIVIGIW